MICKKTIQICSILLENFCIVLLYNLHDLHFFSLHKIYDKSYEIEEQCLAAFKKTVNKDKTINVEAFVDNLAREFNKLKVL